MIRTLAILLVFFACAPALAQSPPPLTVGQVNTIYAAVQVMGCMQRVVRDTMVCEPITADKLKPALAWQIADVQSGSAVVATKYQRARNLLLASAERKPDGNLTEEASAKFLVADADLLDVAAGISLPHFKRADLEPLNLVPGVIAALRPIID